MVPKRARDDRDRSCHHACAKSRLPRSRRVSSCPPGRERARVLRPATRRWRMSLEKQVQAFRDAFATGASYLEAFEALVAESKHATFAERDAAIVQLLDGNEHHAQISGLMCIASGALVEDGASTTLGMETILDRMADGAEILAAAGPALESESLD